MKRKEAVAVAKKQLAAAGEEGSFLNNSGSDAYKSPGLTSPSMSPSDCAEGQFNQQDKELEIIPQEVE